MQKWIFGLLLGLWVAIPAVAQQPSKFDVSAGYTFVSSNAPPGDCGCFIMNGATGSAAFRLTKDLGAVADFSVVHNGNVDASGQSLTLFSYQFGPRYYWKKERRVAPFGEALLGGAHAFGLGYAGATGPASALAVTAGGGADFRLNRRFSLRLFELDYFFTHFQNGVNAHESNLRLTFGIVLHVG